MPPADLLAAAAPILDAIYTNGREAVVLTAINKPAAYDREVIERFNGTYAANVFAFMRRQATLNTVLVLARLWDTNADAQSIPRAARYLARADVVDEIVARRRADRLAIMEHPIITDAAEEDLPLIREARERMAEEGADAAEAQTRAGAVDIIERVDAFLRSPLRDSLHALRSRAIAHTLEMTRDERRAAEAGAPIAALVIGDEDRIREVTLPLITDINLVMRGLHVGFEDMAAVWDRYAQDYWGWFDGTQKGRPRPDPVG
ncbi:hypothetical protein [Azospirillum soli]|uniref:hypothetical protein n=1 Tax=Azospirillum soli TaxID=1304799 RepID=UPI001AE81B9C|nr:hypothetical protein [Azospirillum soli]MBP2315479.1 hypothetical protein [Azospirillum soli]